MNEKKKVFAYITKRNKLLVFKHTDHPDAGIQVPAGTVEDGESIEDAILREASEETGLVKFRIIRFLGKIKFSGDGKKEIETGYFFHLACDDDRMEMDEWRHGEKAQKHFTGVDEEHGMIRFDFFWLDINDAGRLLEGGNGDMIGEIMIEE